MRIDSAAARRAVWGLSAYSTLRQVADVCQMLAINWYLAASTGSAGMLGLAWVVSRLPWTVLPLAGFLADRVPRRRVILLGDLAVAVLGVVAVLVRPGRTAVLIVLAVYALGYAAVRPATKGLPRELAGTSVDAARVSGLMTSLEYAAIFAAQLAVARWLLPRGPAWGLGAMVVTLALGAVILRRTVPAGPPPAAPTRFGMRAVAAMLWSPELRGPLALTVTCGGCAFVLLPLAPLLARGGPAHYGILMAGYSLGAAAGSALARRTDGWRSGTRGAALAWVVAAPALAAAPRVHSVVAILACYVVVGAAAGFADAGNAARVAAHVPLSAQSQAMALGSLVWRLPGVLAGGIVAVAAPLQPASLCPVLAGVLAAVAVGGVLVPAGAPRVPAGPPVG